MAIYIILAAVIVMAIFVLIISYKEDHPKRKVEQAVSLHYRDGCAERYKSPGKGKIIHTLSVLVVLSQSKWVKL